jgi:PPOX class probable F420-dependent enzyme
MPLTISDALARRLQTEEVIWLTTVRDDGSPVPTPVWFYWNGDSFLIYTQPRSHKLRHIAHNPQVALNFNTDEAGGSVAVFSGAASVDDQPPPAAEAEAYLAKYAAGIQMIGLTPETMAAEYSAVLRVQPSRVRTMD